MNNRETNLHEYVSEMRLLASHCAKRECWSDMHFTQIGRAVYVDQPRDVLVGEVSKESNLAQDAFCERDLLQRMSDHLDRDGLPGDVVRGGTRRHG